MARGRKFLYAGTGRYVIALDPQSGAEIWRTKLPSSSSNIITLLLSKSALLVGYSGRVFALDPISGEIRWENGLPRTGFGPVIMAMDGAVGSGQGAVAAAQLIADAESAAATSS